MCGILQAADIQNAAKSNSAIGFSLILQLTGVHGSRQFDKLTKTKTVESILTSMDEAGIQSYIDYLLKQVDEEPSASAEYVLQIFMLPTRPKAGALIIGIFASRCYRGHTHAQRGDRLPGRQHAPRRGD